MQVCSLLRLQPVLAQPLSRLTVFGHLKTCQKVDLSEGRAIVPPRIGQFQTLFTPNIWAECLRKKL